MSKESKFKFYIIYVRVVKVVKTLELSNEFDNVPLLLEDCRFMLSSHCLLGAVWFVVRTLYGTTCLSTNVSCAWKTLKGPYGLWTRWSSTSEGRSAAHPAR